jgi:hypothetical protein
MHYEISYIIDITIIIVIGCGDGILRMHNSYWSWDSSVGIATRLRARQPGKGKRFFSSP